MLSPMAPTTGMTSRPGSTKMAPKEKPRERTRAGMATDSVERTPGPTTARAATIPALPMNATPTEGARANRTAKAAATKAAPPIITKTSRRSREARRVATVAPTARPASEKSCTGAMIRPRASVPRWKVCWYCSEAREAKPMSEAARKGRAKKMRRSTPIFQTSRHASPKVGGSSAGPAASSSSRAARSAATSSAPSGPPRAASSRRRASSSCRPRTGSRRPRPTRTSTRMGTGSTRNGARQPRAWPRPAPPSTPSMDPIATPAKRTENTAGRTRTG